MKQTILFFLVLAFFNNFSDAQSTSFGIKIGLNNNRIADFKDQDINPGLKGVYPKVHQLIGLYVKIPFKKKFRFLSEIMVGKKGAHMIYNDNRPFDNSYSVSATYLSIPLSLGYDYKFMTFEAGIDAGMKLASKVKDAYSNWLYQDHKYDINTLLGIQFHVKKVAFGIRYLNGILPFGEIQLSDVDGNPNGVKKYGKNQTMQVSLTYDFLTI